MRAYKTHIMEKIKYNMDLITHGGLLKNEAWYWNK